MRRTVNALRETGNEELFELTKKVSSEIDFLEVITPDHLRINGEEKTLADTKKTWVAAAKKGEYLDVSFVYDRERLLKYNQKKDALEDLKIQISNKLKKTRNSAAHFQLVNYLTVVTNQLRVIEIANQLAQSQSAVITDVGLDQINRFIENYLRMIYGSPDESIVKMVSDVTPERLKPRRHMTKIPAETRQKLAETKVSSVQLADMMKEVMAYYSDIIGHDVSYKIVIDDKSTACCVYPRYSDGEPRIVVPGNKEYSLQRAIELVAHEICVHWLDNVLGAEYMLLKEGDDTMAEGHALANESMIHQKYSGSDYIPKPFYIYAMKLANSGKTFAEIGKEIIEKYQCEPGNAFTAAYRVLRGSVGEHNLSNFAFTKDRAYFEGYMFAESLIKKGEAGYLDFSVLSRAHFEDFRKLFRAPKPVASRSRLIAKLIEKYI
jgi:hypothetical protein